MVTELKANFSDRDGFGTNQLKIRYIFALTLLASLTIVTQWVIQQSLALQEYDSRIINIAGRQRMLSQRIVKVGYYLIHAKTVDERQAFRRQLASTLDLWVRSHIGLQQGDKELGLPGENNPQIKSLFKSIEHEFQEMVAAGREVLDTSDNSQRLQQLVQHLSKYEAAFLTGMNSIVFQYDDDAKSKLDTARKLEYGLAAFTLLVLLLEALLIFAPVVRRFRDYMQRHEQHEQDMDRLFATTPTAMILMDEETLNIIRGNGKSETLMGSVESGFLGKPVSDFLDTKYDANRVFLEKIQDGNELNEYEVLIINTQHHIVEALASCCRIIYSGRPAYVISATNISEIKKAQKTLQYYATFDEMTGLVNRRTGLLILKTELDRSKRDNLPLTVCYVDIDGLKAINDTYGHHEGDWMIITMANVMSESIRGGDVALRLGGDEFLLILHDCDEKMAWKFISRIEQSFSDISNSEEHSYKLSASFGVVTYDPKRHQDSDDLIMDADAKMYRAKRAKYDAASE